MVNAILVGLTLGLAAKYLIVGNYSSNFFSVIVGIVGSVAAHAWAVNREMYDIGEPLENVIPVLGGIAFLVLYYAFAHRKHSSKDLPKV